MQRVAWLVLALGSGGLGGSACADEGSSGAGGSPGPSSGGATTSEGGASVPGGGGQGAQGGGEGGNGGTAQTGGSATGGSGGGWPGPCAEPLPGECPDTEDFYCDGDNLCSCAPGQPILFECATFGAGVGCGAPKCTFDTGGNRCFQMVAGNPCNVGHGCGPGLACHYPTGTCLEAPVSCGGSSDGICLPDGRRAECLGECDDPTFLHDPCTDGSECYLGGCFQNSPTDLGPDCIDCWRVLLYGTPTWEPVGAVIVPGPVDTTNVNGFYAWEAMLFDPLHTFETSILQLAPGTPHLGPYDGENASVAAAFGLTPRQTYLPSEFANPSGTVLLVTLVPTAIAPTGSSADSASGPIIVPPPIFPPNIVNAGGGLVRFGQAHSIWGSGYVSPDTLHDGVSHLTLVFGANQDTAISAGTPVEGDYEYRLQLTAGGTAFEWLINAKFVVSP